MLNAQELRIGNIVNRENTGHSFEINAQVLFHWDKFKKVLFPMSLTEEWLLRFRFERYDNNILKKGCIICCLGVGDGELKFGIQADNDPYCGTYVDHIKYVHQLQNLYFALTGWDFRFQYM